MISTNSVRGLCGIVVHKTDYSVYYGDIPVGAVCCRIEQIQSKPTLTILTLAYVVPIIALITVFSPLTDLSPSARRWSWPQ